LRPSSLAAATAIVCALASIPALAQDEHEEHHHHDAVPPSAEGWAFAADANVFFGYNKQQRQFADFSAWESQNWAMFTAGHRAGRGRLTFESMLSLEELTIPAGGSPQLFQTGESYHQNPLVNYQHPHDFVMNLGASYKVRFAPVTLSLGADVVGSPTLGPTVFMHRESARNNPQVPLTHHYMDSTHVSYGVLSGGLSRGAFTVEASAFRGAEPDENRWNIEAPHLDSYAGRIRFDRGPWHAQFSAGHLAQPEWFEPYDTNRITASVAYEGMLKDRPLRVTAAWGSNREFNGFNGNNDGYLLEWDTAMNRRWTMYGRTEVAEKELLGLGYHPRGFSHPHVFYTIFALTLGDVYDFSHTRAGRVGVGADVTFYHMPPDIRVYWQGSHSYHVFLRWRPNVATPHVH
jgi:hypothetical protein